MPARKAKGRTAADAKTKARAEELAAADTAAGAAVIELAEGAAEVTRGEDESAAAAAFCCSTRCAGRRPGRRDSVHGR